MNDRRHTVLRWRGAVCHIGINRPDKRNALDLALINELHDVLDEVSRQPSILVLHSAVPGIFVSGADIGELLSRDSESALLGINSSLFTRFARHRWPTIAVVDGPALGGGCELALAADLRVATTRARFGQPELTLGIMAGAGGNWRIAQLAGVGLARRMLYTGETIDATRALDAGLVDLLCEPADAMTTADRVADRILERPWRALELTKLALAQNDADTAAFDRVAQAVLFESTEKKDRMRAFLDRARASRPATTDVR